MTITKAELRAMYRAPIAQGGHGPDWWKDPAVHARFKKKLVPQGRKARRGKPKGKKYSGFPETLHDGKYIIETWKKEVVRPFVERTEHEPLAQCSIR